MRPRTGLASRFAVVIVVAAVAGLAAVLWWHDALTYDVGIYRRYGEAIAAGQVPYRDFRVEYPPGALPVFAGPALVTAGEDAYRVAFALEAAVLEIAALLVGLRLLGRSGAPRAQQYAYVAFVALVAGVPLGSVALSRFDFWPALLVLVALTFSVERKSRAAGAALGIAIAAKIFPVVAAPLLVTHAWRHGGIREARRLIAAMVMAVVALFLPFAIIAPRRLASSLWEQLGRPLQLESLGSSVVIALHRVADMPAHSTFSHGSYNVAGSAASAAAVVTGVMLAAVLCLVWARYFQGPATTARLITHTAAAVATFVAFSKVLSPQFLLWLVALVPLVRGRRGMIASLLLATAAALTTIWIPFRQSALVNEFAPLPSWALLLRNLILVGLVFTLVPPGIRRRTAESSWPPARGEAA